MKIADSARSQLQALLADGGPGAVLSLLIGYTYDPSWNKTPQVDITLLPSDVAEGLKRDYAGADEQLIHIFDGFSFVLTLSDEHGLLEGQTLTYAKAGFSLMREAAD